uniref:Sushi domain-containing protein n=1 Tax=Stegastes partitus TaxID=144197 RepID=A0A3B5A1P8_9TELE
MCSAGGCGVPLNTKDSDANLADKYITMTSFPSGAKVYYVCNVGYTPVGGSRIRICKNGNWTPLRLKCELKSCGSAGEILNGRFVYSGVEFGDTATGVCDDGYTVVGQATRNCMSNGWDGRIPVCEAVVCDEPPEVTGAERRGPQEPPYSYKTVISYRCRTGTLVGQKDIWCTKNGTWSAPPKCNGKITCPSPNVANAFWMGAQNRSFRYKETISIECKRGYIMNGPNSITCNNDGRWIPRLPDVVLKLPYSRNPTSTNASVSEATTGSNSNRWTHQQRHRLNHSSSQRLDSNHISMHSFTITVRKSSCS